MAKKTATATPNAVASHEYIASHSVNMARHADILKAENAELVGQVEELTAKLADEQRIHAEEIQRARETYARDTTALQTKLSAAEEKLRKVFVTLS